jgi:hypothetical protein
VLDPRNFFEALRLRWLWYEWKDPNRTWVGLGNPCDESDKNFFSRDCHHHARGRKEGVILAFHVAPQGEAKRYRLYHI